MSAAPRPAARARRRALAVAAALAGGPAGAAAQLTIRLPVLPQNTPPDAVVHAAGTFNGWNPGDPAAVLRRGADGAYALTLPDSVRGPVAFKLTLGSWARVEAAADGGDVPNRTALVPSAGALTVTAAVAAWRGGAAPARRSTASPGVRVVADSFPMPELGRVRRVWVYLPPGYATSGRRYPVVYLHDGQNVFDAATSFAGEWGVDETLDSLAAAGDPGAVVVAVDNGGTRRLDEYNPWRAADPRLGGGEGDAYVRFLAGTLKPWVDARYRTRRDPAHTVVAGSSMGGLISLYAALRRPDVFGRAGVFSCACWVARPAVYTFAARRRPAGGPGPRFYFVVGAREGRDGGPARDQADMVRTLRAAGVPAAAIAARVAPDGEHAEWFWRREFAAAYRWLVGATPTDGRPRRRARN